MEPNRARKLTYNQIKEDQIVDQKGATYRIDRTSLIYRDSQMNAVYQCLKHHKSKISSQLLCIKEYSEFTSQEQIMKQWDTLKSIQKLQIQPSYASFFMEFITTKQKHHYLVMRPFKQTLMDKYQFGCRNLKQNSLNKKFQNFGRDISSLLLMLQKEHKSNFILTTLKPHFIICYENQNFMLTNFSNLIIINSEDVAKFETRKGEGLYYYAPQMLQGKIGVKSNVWSFGCILYEILCNGQKLIESEKRYLEMKGQKLSRYIKQRLTYCQYRLNTLQDDPIQTKSFWLYVCQLCLQRQINKRIGIDELHQTIISEKHMNKWQELDSLSLQAHIFYELSFQYYRANLLQSKIFAIFEQLYKMEANSNKYLIYIVIKFAAIVFVENYQLSRERAEVFCKKDNKDRLKKIANEKLWHDRYSLFFAMNEAKKIKEIKNKITQKIQKWMQIEQNQFEYQISKYQAEDEQNKPINLYVQKNKMVRDELNVFYDKKKVREDIKKYFVEYQDRKVYDSTNILYAFCYKYAVELQQNKTIYILIAEILQYTKKLIDFDELQYEKLDSQTNIDVLALKMMYPFFNRCQDQAQDNPKEIITTIYLSAQETNKISQQRMHEIQQTH